MKPPSSPPPPPILNLLTLERVSYYPVLGSEIVGSAKLRKHEHKNKAGGNWGEGALPFSRPCPPFSRLHALVFVCLSLMHHPYYLKAWNRLILCEIESRHKNTIVQYCSEIINENKLE